MRRAGYTRQTPGVYPGAIAQHSPDLAALIMGATGDVITYRELDERSNRLAQLFRARGLAPGDAVAIFMERNERFMRIAWVAQPSGVL